MYPQIWIIEDKKEDLVMKFESLNELQTRGISFQDLQIEARKDNTNSWFIWDSIPLIVDKNFYTSFFINPDSISYWEFLDTIQERVAETKQSEEYRNKLSTFDSILPYYSPDVQLEGDSLSDSHFINHVENILYTFNLRAQWDIGVWGIQKKDQNIQLEWSPDDDIYKIPLSFKIEWRKNDIIDFLHFLEHVWSIEIQDDEVRVYSDSFITKTLSGREEDNSNIYDNQLADVESLVLTQYPDSSSIKSEVDLITRLKSEQAREKMEADISLNFYVSWFPKYRIQSFVWDFLRKYQELSDKILWDTAKYGALLYSYSTGEEIQAVASLESLALLITQLDPEIQALKKQMNTSQDLGQLYDNVVKYDARLDQIEVKYEQQKNLLTEK